jgi:hypothetical protein
MRQFYAPIEAASANVVDLRAVPEARRRQDRAGAAGAASGRTVAAVFRSGTAVPRLLAWAACLSPLLGLLASCGTPPLSRGCGELPCDSQRSFTTTSQNSTPARLDLLFVIDDTPAIAPYTASLTATLSAIPARLAAVFGGDPSLHVRFLPATLPSPGCPTTSRAATCGVGPDETLRTGLCGSNPSFTGGVAETFVCLSDRGSSGCGPLQSLEAARRALATDGDFLRPDAYLAVVIVAGADDASASPVDAYVEFVKSLKVDPANQVFVSVIAPAAPACSGSAPGEPVRLGAFARAFGRNGVLQSTCAPSPLAALPQLDAAQRSVEPYCLRGLRDTDPARDGMQADCVVTEVIWERYPDDPRTTRVPACDDAAPPCWRLEAFNGCRGGWKATIERGVDWCPLVATQTSYECLGCVDPNDPACAAP